jgi:hypothetical protein
VADLVNKHSVNDTLAWADPALGSSIPAGTKLQLERKGYYILDQVPSVSNGYRAVLINIPDGRAPKYGVAAPVKK